MGPLRAEDTLTTLSAATLSGLRTQVSRPLYDRAALTPGILHIGVGNFHRAHQAAYLDDLFATGHGHDWGIVGAGLMPFDRQQRQVMQAQDWLYSLTELSPGRADARIIGSVVDFCPTNPGAMVQRIADPSIRIVSLTITEGGYFIDPATEGFDETHPLIRADAANPDTPQTVFGVLLAGLRLRRENGLPMPTVMSCDNIQHNGDVTRRTLSGLAGMISVQEADWVSSTVAFPNSMVDRITPGTGDAERTLARNLIGLTDAAPVVCEPFRQWVLEDRFALGRPSLERVGVQFVDDVAPYETMKLRILNAGHAAIAYPAALLGHEHVHEAMADPDIAAWLNTLMNREIIPNLDSIPGEDPRRYLADCAERFANTEVRDTVARLAQDGSNRQPKFILPTIADAVATNRPVRGLALELAFWCRFAALAQDLDDPRATEISPLARASSNDPSSFLNQPEIFGDLVRNKGFRAAFTCWIKRLWNEPVRAVLRDYLKESGA